MSFLRRLAELSAVSRLEVLDGRFTIVVFILVVFIFVVLIFVVLFRGDKIKCREDQASFLLSLLVLILALILFVLILILFVFVRGKEIKSHLRECFIVYEEVILFLSLTLKERNLMEVVTMLNHV